MITCAESALEIQSAAEPLINRIDNYLKPVPRTIRTNQLPDQFIHGLNGHCCVTRPLSLSLSFFPSDSLRSDTLCTIFSPRFIHVVFVVFVFLSWPEKSQLSQPFPAWRFPLRCLGILSCAQADSLAFHAFHWRNTGRARDISEPITLSEICNSQWQLVAGWKSPLTTLSIFMIGCRYKGNDHIWIRPVHCTRADLSIDV